MTTTEELTLRNTSPTLCAWPGDGKTPHEIPSSISTTRNRCMVVVSSILRRGPTRGAGLRPGVLRLQVALGLEGGHAAGARGRHGLAIGEVGDIAGREDAGHGRLGGAGQHLDVVVRVVDDLYLTSEPGEIQGLFHGGIASPHDHDVLVLEEEAVAGGAGRDAAPHELGLAGEPDQLGGGAGGDDHGERLDRRVPGRDTEGASTEVDL